MLDWLPLDREQKRILVISVLAGIVAIVALTIYYIIPQSKYSKAMKYYNQEDYVSAKEIFLDIYYYRDSWPIYQDCKAQIKRQQYEAAIALYEAGDYLNAVQAFRDMEGYKDSKAYIEKCEEPVKQAKYNEAKQAIADQDYVAAYDALLCLDGYMDSDALLEDVLPKTYATMFADVKIGDIVSLGRYEQDNDETDGMEKLEWQVLDEKDGKFFVVTKNCIDARQFHTAYVFITWENCEIRRWLNNEFMDIAFIPLEKERIQLTHVLNPDHEGYGTVGGNDTEDYIFLMDLKEVEKYFPTDESRKAYATYYAKAQGAFVSVPHKATWWWLRTPGGVQNRSIFISYDGTIDGSGANVSLKTTTIRPAMWVDLNP